MKKRIKKIAKVVVIVLFVVIVLTLTFLFTTVTGFGLHELGHALMAMFFKIPIVDWHIGVGAYVILDTINATNFQMAMISLGSFIFPELIYLIIFLISKNPYITMVRILTGLLLYCNIIGNIIILIGGTKSPEDFDITMFQQYTNVNSGIIIGSLILVLMMNIILELVSGRIKNLFLYIAKKI